MRYSILLLLFCKTFLSASEPISKIELEKDIQKLENELIASKDKNTIKSQLASAYFQDQAQEKAFKVFLDALKTPPSINTPISKEESAVYSEALSIYHNPSNS
jgi:thioredoxin-like negative regulator of GroEL